MISPWSMADGAAGVRTLLRRVLIVDVRARYLHSAINDSKDIVTSPAAVPPGVFSLHASARSWIGLGVLWLCIRAVDLVEDMVRRLKRDITAARNRLEAMRRHP